VVSVLLRNICPPCAHRALAFGRHHDPYSLRSPASGLAGAARVRMRCAVVILVLGFTRAAVGTDYFLTIGGGYSPKGNQVSLEKNVQFFQRVLDRFYPKGVDHTVLFADGDDPARDLQFRPSESGMSEAREAVAHLFGQTRYLYDQYRNHELDRVAGPSSKSELESWFESVRKRLEAGDRVFIYVTAHGGRAADKKQPHNTKLYLWNNQSITMRDFAKQLDKLPETVPLVFVMVQCYSGGFSHLIFRGGDPDQGVAPQPRCGFLATVHTRPAAGCTPEINEENYHEYSTYFWAAISGTSRTGEPVEGADLDGDGRVSFLEAHAYALRESITIDISVKTSDAFLREYSTMPLAEETGNDSAAIDWYSADTPFDLLIADAREDERCVAVTLSQELDLSQEARASQAKELAKRLDNQKKQLSKEIGRLSRKRHLLAAAVRKSLLAHWPEFSNPWHPEVAHALDHESDAVMKVLRRSHQYAELLKLDKQLRAKTEQRSAVEKRWVKCQRLIRCLENMALEHNLPFVATTDEQQAYARLVELERQSLGAAR